MPDLTYTPIRVPRRPLVFLAESVKSPPFSDAARKEAGALLAQVQEGTELGMPRSRPLPVIGPRCHELRINDENVTWRIIYRIDLAVIVVPGLFAKKSRTLPNRMIETCRKRLAAYDAQTKGKH
ncbi:MAG TPA: type II toxin-antitoxin system RelE/ParE family toxin [Longimicrobiaceae bacterium]|nr:type II toxin-antitoxin system RelE/ParE family toxin [Longimicrobiaceae bacterium]